MITWNFLNLTSYCIITLLRSHFHQRYPRSARVQKCSKRRWLNRSWGDLTSVHDVCGVQEFQGKAYLTQVSYHDQWCFDIPRSMCYRHWSLIQVFQHTCVAKARCQRIWQFEIFQLMTHACTCVHMMGAGGLSKVSECIAVSNWFQLIKIYHASDSCKTKRLY